MTELFIFWKIKNGHKINNYIIFGFFIQNNILWLINNLSDIEIILFFLGYKQKRESYKQYIFESSIFYGPK